MYFQIHDFPHIFLRVVIMCSYFQDGLKTIEHFHCYIEELVVQLSRLKQKQDAERRNLVELRDVLRNFMSSYKEVNACSDCMLSVRHDVNRLQLIVLESLELWNTFIQGSYSISESCEWMLSVCDLLQLLYDVRLFVVSFDVILMTAAICIVSVQAEDLNTLDDFVYFVLYTCTYYWNNWHTYSTFRALHFGLKAFSWHSSNCRSQNFWFW